jgi:hypothetical protein
MTPRPKSLAFLERSVRDHPEPAQQTTPKRARRNEYLAARRSLLLRMVATQPTVKRPFSVNETIRFIDRKPTILRFA